ncbi:DNA-directed RNA polymerase sigma-70 factor [Hymenobacter qilianensis]|uniref:DNA-directed RNA polymerase sigma-70 factor n=2 Tax=Hymenobacter qilianensis TaxID=1385715 RepID=A0ACB5PR69_9BACT|nr:sigma-70 family RNA polymerase sigma factor [Hymenobacter qilianensis]QNP52017.1 sigma-70 family RNA polymerase sigma factor [Hymenobacter qilianensis]GGF63791.1 DNA-directed RNA polymerase sigma-70 factor [Hymenobacter qilianensis]
MLYFRTAAASICSKPHILQSVPVSVNHPESLIPAPEELLVQRLRDRDEAAMTVFYDKYSAALYGVILRIVKKEEIAEDVLQESLVKIWHSFASYDASKGRLFTWVVNVCRNLAIDKIRSRQYRVGSRTQPLEDSAAVRQAAPTGFQPDHIGLQEITKKLNPEQKQVIDLLYFGGFTQSEVADELNLPLGTVKTRARAAIKVLAKLVR